MTIHLRPYQEQALAAESQHRADHPDETRLAIVMATGLGKTIVMAERAVRFLDSFEGAGNRVVILVHTDELAQQAEATVRLVAEPFTVGMVKAARDEVNADIIIASVQTLSRPGRMERIRHVGLVMVDECHHAVAEGYQRILRYFGCFNSTTASAIGNSGKLMEVARYLESFPPTPVLGVTATLERGDGASLGGVWQNVAFTRDISWGVRHGYLVQPVGYRLEIDGPRLGHDSPSGPDIPRTLVDDWLVNALAPQKIVEEWIRLAKGRPTVAFMPLVRSARALADSFIEAGVGAAVISGQTPRAECDQIYADFAAGKTDVICNAMKLTEGWDPPASRRVNCVIIGRPTKSRTLFIQMAGRGLRPQAGIPVEEQNCILLCVADSTTDLCTVADLSDKPLDRRMQGALTAMEDEWDIGQGIEDPERVWTGRVDTRQFDPLVARSSKVWRTTKHGTPYLPISKDGEYVFIVGTSVFVRRKAFDHVGTIRVKRLHKDLPDLELAMSIAEDEAQERGGDLGKLLADKNRAWRKERPSEEMIGMAERLGLAAEVAKVMNTRAGGKAGKVSDLISATLATRALEPMVERIKEMTDA